MGDETRRIDEYDFGDDPMMKAMDEAQNETLKGFDAARPIDGIAAMVERVVQKQPMMEELFRMEVSKMAPGSEGKSMNELARIVAEKAIEDEPAMVEILTVAAEKARNGASGMAALMEASTQYSNDNVVGHTGNEVEGEGDGRWEEPYPAEGGEPVVDEVSVDEAGEARATGRRDAGSRFDDVSGRSAAFGGRAAGRAL